MRIISRKTLKDFWAEHPDCEQQLKTWYKETKKAEWKSVAAIKIDFPTLSVVGNSRFVFNIKGNNYRLIARINFVFQIVWIRFIGTHKEYDKIDAKNS